MTTYPTFNVLASWADVYLTDASDVLVPVLGFDIRESMVADRMSVYGLWNKLVGHTKSRQETTLEVRLELGLFAEDGLRDQPVRELRRLCRLTIPDRVRLVVHPDGKGKPLHLSRFLDLRFRDRRIKSGDSQDVAEAVVTFDVLGGEQIMPCECDYCIVYEVMES